MKRVWVFMLAVLILFTCSACKKETLPATQPGSAQTAAGETEQTVSGVSVRIPAVQYRLARTEPEGLMVGGALLPYSGGAVLTGSMFTGSADEPLRTEAAAYYTPERGCTVQELPVSLDGIAVQAAMEGEQLYYIEARGNTDDTQWILHTDGQEHILDEALSGVSTLTAMAVQNEDVLLAADGSCVLACAMDGTLRWKQPAAEIERFFRTQDGALYRLPQTYLLATVAGLPDIVGGREAWSMADFLDTAQAHPEIGSVFAQDDGASMLQLLLLYAPDAFVDYETMRASFDSPDFLRLLELAKRQTQPEAESPREALLTGQTLLEQLMIGRAQYFEEEYEDGLNRLAIPGFPGAGRASFYLTLPMAIPVNAQEKEGAWAFLMLLITEPLYAARSRGGWLPVQSDFEKKTAAMTDADAQRLLRELQAEAVSVFEYDAAVSGILADELPYYFAEEQSAGQIADRIQRRVQLYLEETRR